jgi:hypothetical protein
MAAEMDNDTDFDAALRGRAAEAAKRWHERTEIRNQKAVDEGYALAAGMRKLYWRAAYGPDIQMTQMSGPTSDAKQGGFGHLRVSAQASVAK